MTTKQTHKPEFIDISPGAKLPQEGGLVVAGELSCNSHMHLNGGGEIVLSAMSVPWTWGYFDIVIKNGEIKIGCPADLDEDREGGEPYLHGYVKSSMINLYDGDLFIGFEDINFSRYFVLSGTVCPEKTGKAKGVQRDFTIELVRKGCIKTLINHDICYHGRR
jgi:hypothetical protein